MTEAHENKTDQHKAFLKGKVRAKRGKPIKGAAQFRQPTALAIVDPAPLTLGCPPADAIDGPIRLFRMPATKEPAAYDCLTAYEGGTFLDTEPCRRRSRSSHTDRVNAERLRR